MVLIDKGEASNAIQTWISLQTDALNQSGQFLESLLDLLKTLKASRESTSSEQGVNHPNDDASSLSALRAVIVADILLRESGRDRLQGNMYEFQRAEDGAIAVFCLRSRQRLAHLSADGKVSEQMDVETTRNFERMLQKLQAARPPTSALNPRAKQIQIDRL